MEQIAPIDDVSQAYEASRYGALVLDLGRVFDVYSPRERTSGILFVLLIRLGRLSPMWSSLIASSRLL